MSWMFAVGCGGGDDNSDDTTTKDSGAGKDVTTGNPGDDTNPDTGTGLGSPDTGTGTKGDSSTGPQDGGEDSGDATVSDGGSEAGADAGDAGHDAGDAGDAAVAPTLFKLVGRWDTTTKAGFATAQLPGSGIIADFEGEGISLNLTEVVGSWAGTGAGNGDLLDVYLDGVKQPSVAVNNTTTVVKLATATTQGTQNAPHKIEVYKADDSSTGTITINTTTPFVLDGTLNTNNLVPEPHGFAHKIEFIGDDYMWGYGDLPACDGTNAGVFQSGATTPALSDENLAYPFLIATNFNAEHVTTAVSGMGVKFDYSGSTQLIAPSLWTRTLPLTDVNGSWKPANFVPDVVVVDLGATTDMASVTGKTSATESGADFSTAYTNFLTQVYTAYTGAGGNPYMLVAIGSSYISAEQTDITNTQTYTTTAFNNFKTANKNAKADIVTLTAPADNTYIGCDFHPGHKQHQVIAMQLEAQIHTALGW